MRDVRWLGKEDSLWFANDIFGKGHYSELATAHMDPNSGINDASFEVNQSHAAIIITVPPFLQRRISPPHLSGGEMINPTPKSNKRKASTSASKD